MERVEIIAVGSEILEGEVRELNSCFLSGALARIGLAPSRVTVLPDDIDAIEEEIRDASARSTIVVVTGGLGPTVDDVTKEAAIRALGCGSEVREEVVRRVEERFRRLGREMPDMYRDQARVPREAVILPNSVGAAVGLHMRASNADLFILPGVPEEMREMFRQSVLPAVSGRGMAAARRVRTFGLTETALEQRLRDVLHDDELAGLSIISGPSGVDLYVPAGPRGGCVIDSIRAVLGSYLYTIGEERIEEVILAILADRRARLATVESVTGGLLASTIISVPGASEVFTEGIVAYSDESKIEHAGVGTAIIREHGAVSEAVCVAMARGVLERSGADVALSTTGIAGPGGGSAKKPVGLCYIGLAASGELLCRRFRIPGTRDMVRLRAVYRALDLLRLHLIGADDRIGSCRIGDM